MSRLFLFSLCTVLGLGVISRAAEAPNDASLATLTYSGDQSALNELDREITAAATDAKKLTAIEQRLLAALRRSDATYAARQAICQRLALVLAQTEAKTKADAYKPLGTMLADDRDSDLARLALEPAVGGVFDSMLVTALGKTSGRTRIGLIDSLGRRRTASAVSALTPLLNDSDSATAAAAAKALARIGNVAALSALRNAPVNPTTIAATIAIAPHVPAADGLRVLREIQASSAAPVHLRAAALRTALQLEPAAAMARIAEVLRGSDLVMKQAALEATADVEAPDLVPTLTSGLASWDAVTQTAVITALGRRGTAAAVPAVLGALAHADADVRAAAIDALGMLPGNADVVTALARIASGANVDEAKLARQSLARLNGPEVSLTILAGAERGDPPLRVVFLEQLALRNMTEGLPLLLRSRADPDAAVRSAAVGALGDLAPPSEQRALIDWAVAATDDAEQARALRALVNVTLRNPKTDERGRAVYAAIEQAPANVALRLVPALARIGGAASAECAARLAVRDDAKLAAAAVDTLGRWTGNTALPSLATVAEKAELPATRAAAVNAALRFFERNREPWTSDDTTVVSRLLAASTETASRQKLVDLLRRAKDEPALALAERLQKDPAIGARARDAVTVIRANRAGPPALRVSDNASSAKNILDGKTSSRWNAATDGQAWVEVDFKATRPIERVILDETGRADEFPEHYEVFVSDDAQHLGPVRASGHGQRNKTEIALPAGTSGRYLVIKDIEERKDGQWSICELFVE
jgi:HEAT repeat protein